jgi:hypothetical protein
MSGLIQAYDDGTDHAVATRTKGITAVSFVNIAFNPKNNISRFNPTFNETI